MRVGYTRNKGEKDALNCCDKVVFITEDCICRADVEALGEGDTFVIKTLNTLGTDNEHNLDLLKSLSSRGVLVEVLNLGLIDKSRLNDIEVIFGYEKQRMIEKVKRAKEIAKKTNKNYKDGRPRTYSDEVEKYVVGLLNKGNTYTEIVKLTGISRATISRIRKKNIDKITKK